MGGQGICRNGPDLEHGHGIRLFDSQRGTSRLFGLVSRQNEKNQPLMNQYLFLACSVCFGNPDSQMTKGAMLGVFFLLGLVVFVLGAIASVAVTWSRRARKLSHHE